MYVNKDRVEELEKAIKKEVENGGKSFILQYCLSTFFYLDSDLKEITKRMW